MIPFRFNKNKRERHEDRLESSIIVNYVKHPDNNVNSIAEWLHIDDENYTKRRMVRAVGIIPKDSGILRYCSAVVQFDTKELKTKCIEEKLKVSPFLKLWDHTNVTKAHMATLGFDAVKFVKIDD